MCRHAGGVSSAGNQRHHVAVAVAAVSWLLLRVTPPRARCRCGCHMYEVIPVWSDELLVLSKLPVMNKMNGSLQLHHLQLLLDICGHKFLGQWLKLVDNVSEASSTLEYPTPWTDVNGVI